MVGDEAGDAERVAAVGDHRHEVIDPALDVGLAHAQLDSAVKHLHQRHWVDPPRLPDTSQVTAVGFSEGLRAELCRGPGDGHHRHTRADAHRLPP